MRFLTTLEPRQFVSARCSDATRIHAEKDIKKLINEYTRQIKRGGGGVDMLRSVDAPALPTVVPSWKCQNRRSASAWRASGRLLMHPSNKRDGHSDSFRHTHAHTHWLCSTLFITDGCLLTYIRGGVKVFPWQRWKFMQRTSGELICPIEPTLSEAVQTVTVSLDSFICLFHINKSQSSSSPFPISPVFMYV